VKFHVITDKSGQLLAWIKATAASQTGPHAIVVPADPAHVVHENIEVDVELSDRPSLAAALQKAVADRIDGRH
jgi:hypothetical protein